MRKIYIRVLQQDKEDEIRIGKPIMVGNLEDAVNKCKAAYAQRCAWCGGMEAACERYYQRIAIVDADTLTELRSIYPKQ